MAHAAGLTRSDDVCSAQSRGRFEEVGVYTRDGSNIATCGSCCCPQKTGRADPRAERRAGVRSAGRVLGHLARAYRARHAACPARASQADPRQRVAGVARPARGRRRSGEVGCGRLTRRPRTVGAAGGMAEEVELPCNRHRTSPHRLEVISDGHRSASTPRTQLQPQDALSLPVGGVGLQQARYEEDPQDVPDESRGARLNHADRA
jgi:hypothetical protein